MFRFFVRLFRRDRPDAAYRLRHSVVPVPAMAPAGPVARPAPPPPPPPPAPSRQAPSPPPAPPAGADQPRVRFIMQDGRVVAGRHPDVEARIRRYAGLLTR